MRRSRVGKGIALMVIAAFSFATPLRPIAVARADAPGIKTLAVVGVAGAGLLFALSAMTGPAQVMATAGAAGAAAAVPLGSAVGAAATGSTGILGMLGTGARALMSAIGLGGGGATAGAAEAAGASGALHFLTSPWFLVPAAIIGAALLAHFFFNHYSSFAYSRDNFGRYDAQSGERYNDPYYGGRPINPYTGPASALATTQAGPPFASLNPVNSMGGAYVPPGLMMSGYYGQLGNTLVGGPSAFSVNNMGFVNGFAGLNPGVGYGTVTPPTVVRAAGGIGLPTPGGYTPSGFPQQGLPVDDATRAIMDADQVTGTMRHSFQTPQAPSSTSLPGSLKAAQAARNSAYGRLLDALRATSAGGSSVEMQKAIADFQSADAALRSLSVSQAAAAK